MKQLEKPVISLFFITLFMMQIAFAVSSSACDPITNTCCCQEERANFTPCASNPDAEYVSCCPIETKHTAGDEGDCYCPGEVDFPEFLQTSRVSVPDIKYLENIKVGLINILELTLSITFASKTASYAERPVELLPRFSTLAWLTVCLRC